MDTGIHQESGLSKSIWSDTDFEEMGWHDATVYGFSMRKTDEILPDLLLDLDHIVRWVHPTPPETYFSFWISPATLVFDSVWDLEGDLDFKGMAPDLVIDAVHRLPPEDGQQGYPQWHIEGHSFDLKFRASGYRQYFRQPPRLASRQVLPWAERGDCSFAETGFH
ncbi:hypothetical protein [Streptomyces sp. NPDC002537]